MTMTVAEYIAKIRPRFKPNGIYALSVHMRERELPIIAMAFATQDGQLDRLERRYGSAQITAIDEDVDCMVTLYCYPEASA